MDKKLILAVAGAGKTTHIVKQLNKEKRSLIVTYTDCNYSNLEKKISDKFNGEIPKNITIYTYYGFLYNFCYKPFWSDKLKAKGISYEVPPQYLSKDKLEFFVDKNKRFYSNRFACFIQECGDWFAKVKERIMKYYDELIIDEIQDIAGRDFNFLMKLSSKCNINMLFVGDFFQHTYDTSRDGNVNKNLFDDIEKYKKNFIKVGFKIDSDTLNKSFRCSKKVCDFIRRNFGIEIFHHDDLNRGQIFDLNDFDANEIIHKRDIPKLHYQNSKKYGVGHKNWGEVKGEDLYKDVCVCLNKSTLDFYKNKNLKQLSIYTRNKLYVALTRAHNNVYLLDEKDCNIVKKIYKLPFSYKNLVHP